MVIYYEFLYKPKTEGESEIDALSRKMAFKLPIVVRYSIGGAIVFGMLHSIVARNPVWAKRYFFMTPLAGAGLCYQDIFKYLEIKGLITPRKEEENPSQEKVP